MSALIILVVGGLWAAVLFASTYFVTFFLPNKGVRAGLGVVAMIGLFTLPLRDEIKGAEEFEALCKAGGVYQISPNAVGKKFDLKSSDTGYTKLHGYARPVEEMTIVYADKLTGEVVATAKAYFAGGGWLVKQGLLRNSGGGNGALLGRPQCFPPDQEAARLQAITNITVN